MMLSTSSRAGIEDLIVGQKGKQRADGKLAPDDPDTANQHDQGAAEGLQSGINEAAGIVPIERFTAKPVVFSEAAHDGLIYPAVEIEDLYHKGMFDSGLDSTVMNGISLDDRLLKTRQNPAKILRNKDVEADDSQHHQAQIHIQNQDAHRAKDDEGCILDHPDCGGDKGFMNEKRVLYGPVEEVFFRILLKFEPGHPVDTGHDVLPHLHNHNKIEFPEDASIPDRYQSYQSRKQKVSHQNPDNHGYGIGGQSFIYIILGGVGNDEAHR